MQSYLIARLLTGVITLFGISFIVFGMINLVPGDVIAVLVGDAGYTQEEAREIEHELGLDKPLPERYVRWLGDLFQGDLGESIKSGREVKDIIRASVPVTLELAIMVFVMATLVGIPLGVWSAVRQDKVDDYIMRITAILGLSIPSFWIGTMVIVLPAIWWGWVPPLFYKDFLDDPMGNIGIMITPAAILTANVSAVLIRMTRSSVLEVLREDYVRTARAKGLGSTAIMSRHVLRNAVLPVLTVLGNYAAFLITGTVTLETIFNLPGLGTTVVTALNNRDFPVVTGVTLIIAMGVVLVNLIVDVLYRVFDPRVSY